MIKHILFILSFTYGLTSVAQDEVLEMEVTWEDLTDVYFTEEYNEMIGTYQFIPDFGPSVEALNGETIIITGYAIPIDVASNSYALSANPYATCFFCGIGGAETVMDLRLEDEDERFKTDDIITVKGRFRLNAQNMMELNYVLEEAEVLKD